MRKNGVGGIEELTLSGLSRVFGKLQYIHLELFTFSVDTLRYRWSEVFSRVWAETLRQNKSKIEKNLLVYFTLNRRRDFESDHILVKKSKYNLFEKYFQILFLITKRS